MVQNKKRFRFDFQVEIIAADHETGCFQIVLLPDPRRYEDVIIEGQAYLYDKFDNFLLPKEKFLREVVKHLENQPLLSAPKIIRNIEEYTKARLKPMRDFILGKVENYEFQDKSEELLNSLSSDKLQFVILSIDIVGSTKLSQQLSEEENAQVITLFLREVANIVSAFGGFVLKYLGDGLLAYFPEPNFIGVNDNAIDCATCIKYFIVAGLNMVLKEQRLPALHFRMGLDSGAALIRVIGTPAAKMHKDLVGETVNIAVKIQSLAGKDQIFLGDVTARNVHVIWRQIIEEVEIPAGWVYKDRETGKPYPIHRVKY
jgi:class 3 adenylate cyclase